MAKTMEHGKKRETLCKNPGVYRKPYVWKCGSQPERPCLPPKGKQGTIGGSEDISLTGLITAK